MIAKVPAKRNDAKSSFRTLRDYIARMESIDPETGEATYEGVSVETNCLSFHTSSAEMRAAAAMNTRVKDPVYHVVLSWQAGESPSDEQLFSAGRDAMAAVGMEGHQYVFAAHRDTEHHHLHMMVNRVHPETEKAVYPDRDFFKLDKCMREVELAQGWAHSNGVFAVVEEDGKPVVRWTSEAGMQTAEKKPTAARDLESSTGRESFFAFATTPRTRMAVSKALSRPDLDWQALHAVLAKNGLELRVKGMGFGVFDPSNDDQTPIKASDLLEGLGRGKLEKRLGKFVPASRDGQLPPPVALYDPKGPAKRDPTTREAKKLDRKHARTELLERYREAKKVHKEGASAVIAEIKNNQAKELSAAAQAFKVRRAEARQKFRDPKLLSIQYGAAKMDLEETRKQIRDRASAARKAAAFPSRDEWIGEQAMSCDEAAMAYMRGLYYAEQRRAKRLAEEEAENSIRPALPSDDYDLKVGAKAFDRMSYAYDSANACLIYRHDGRDAFVDRGQRMDFVPGALHNEAIVAALQLAKSKYGTVLDLKGSPEFCERVIKLAARENLPIRFKDAAQEAQRLAFIAAPPIDQKRVTTARPTRQRQASEPVATPTTETPVIKEAPETVAQWIHRLQAEGASQGLAYREIREGERQVGQIEAIRVLGGEQYAILNAGMDLRIIIKLPGELQLGQLYKGRLVDGQMQHEVPKPRTHERGR